MEDIGQEYAELADSVMINGAPPGTSHFQILQDRYTYFVKKMWDFFYSDINLEVEKIRSDDNHINHSRIFEGNLIFFVQFILVLNIDLEKDLFSSNQAASNTY